MSTRKPELLWGIALALILAAALYLRIADLGRIGFWWDELYHVTAAQSLLQHGDVYIPLIGLYDRSLPTTWIVAAMFAAFGESEFVARLPFALIGVLFVSIVYGVTLKLLGRGAAMLAAVFVAFSPLNVELAREARMYMPFALFYFLASIAFLKGLEPQADHVTRLTRIERRYNVSILRLTLSAVLLAIAFSFHDLALTFGLTALVYCLCALGLEIWAHRAFRTTAVRYALVLAAGVAVALIAYIAAPERFESTVFAQLIPPEEWPSRDWTYYRYFLSDGYPAFFFVYPLAALLTIRRFGRRGLFLVLSFAVLIALHMFVIARRWDRYIVYILPFFAMVSGYLLSEVLKAGWAFVRGTFRGSPFVIWSVVGVAALLAFNVVGHPFIAASRYEPGLKRYPTFKGFPVPLRNDLLAADATVITTRIMAYRYYLGAPPDFGIATSTEYRFDVDEREGIRAIKSLEELATLIESASGPLYLVATPPTFRADSIISDEMRSLIQEHMSLIDTGGFEDAVVYFRPSRLSPNEATLEGSTKRPGLAEEQPL